MTTERIVDGHRPRFELQQVLADGTETIEVCSLPELLRRAEAVHLGRRGLVGLSALTASAALLVGCCGTGSSRRTPTPRSTPTPTRRAVSAEPTTSVSTQLPTAAPPGCAGLQAHTQDVNAVSISPDGSLVASASSDKNVKLWRTGDGSLAHQLRGHTGNVNGVAFSPDGTLLASASADNSARLWHTNDGSLVRELPGHVGVVTSVAFSPDGQLLVSGSRDKSIRLWATDELAGAPVVCFFDPAATPTDQKANTYKITDASGITRTYTLPCGSPIPAGAICTCNCIPGTYRVAPSTGTGGSFCTCDKICTCIPVRKYCNVMFR